jgi:hypothetical protein
MIIEMPGAGYLDHIGVPLIPGWSTQVRDVHGASRLIKLRAWLMRARLQGWFLTMPDRCASEPWTETRMVPELGGT